jgi:catechol 2,3-dioxygenase-like lactoylglutathione lyase family enzyme
MTAARELRFAFTFEDYDAAVRLFRDVLRLETVEVLDHAGGRGVIMRVPSATLELFDPAQTAWVDDLEAGRPLHERTRIAIRVDDLAEASALVGAAGAIPEAEPVDTPWGDRNQRFRTVDGVQLTFFQPPR